MFRPLCVAGRRVAAFVFPLSAIFGVSFAMADEPAAPSDREESPPQFVIIDGHRVPTKVLPPSATRISPPDDPDRRVITIAPRAIGRGSGIVEVVDPGQPSSQPDVATGEVSDRAAAIAALPYPRVQVRNRFFQRGPQFVPRYGFSSPWGYGGLGYELAMQDAYYAGRYDAFDQLRSNELDEQYEIRRQQLLSNFEQALERGVERLRVGDYSRAVIDFSMAAELNQEDPASRIHLAQARLGLGHYRDAGRVLRRALELQPKLVYLELRLPTYLPPGEYDEQVGALSRRLHAQSAHVDEFFALGFFEFQRGNYRQAYEAFAYASRATPRDDILLTFMEITKPPTRP